MVQDLQDECDCCKAKITKLQNCSKSNSTKVLGNEKIDELMALSEKTKSIGDDFKEWSPSIENRNNSMRNWKSKMAMMALLQPINSKVVIKNREESTNKEGQTVSTTTTMTIQQ